MELLQRDLVNIEAHILDTGHFALEEDAPFIASTIRRFVQGAKAFARKADDEGGQV